MLLDILLPPRCAKCGVMVGAGAGTGVCAGCWGSLTFISDPVCARCGAPQVYALPEGMGCDHLCLGTHSALTAGRSALVYGGGGRELILGFKHADQTERARFLARWMISAGAAFWGHQPVIVPVPLHWRRLWHRRYNQAALLAREIGRGTGCAVQVNAVRRLSHTAPQKGISPAQRRANVAGQFAVPRPEQIQGRVVVLVDDVWTTGATLEAVADTLKSAGAKAVYALTAARVIRQEEEDASATPFRSKRQGSGR